MEANRNDTFVAKLTLESLNFTNFFQTVWFLPTAALGAMVAATTAAAAAVSPLG